MFRSLNRQCVIYFCLICFCKATQSFHDEYYIVHTTKGFLLGKQNNTENLGIPYLSFSGIPYAKPPIGDLRFREPVPNDRWEGLKDATKEGNPCIQPGQGNEDCLFLNVHTPQINKTDLLPVMVFIHGGFYFEGSGGVGKQNPENFLEEGVILVMMNYRLGIFGFFSTEDEAAYGNWGIKDQILALQWVQENIEFFGGNKNNVTIFGHSSGSSCVQYIVQTPLAKNLFHKAIMQSGSILNVWAHARQARSVAFAVGFVLGISANESRNLTESVRKLDASRITEASDLLYILFESTIIDFKDGLVFSPTIEPEHDGAVITGRNYDILNMGNFTKVPLMIGFVSQEGFNIYRFLDIIRPYLLNFDIFRNRALPIDMNVNESMKAEAVNELRERYFGDKPLISANLELAQYITDDQFVRGIHESVRLMSRYTDVFYYRFSYLGDGQEEKGPGTGVPHGGELTYLFGGKMENASYSDIITSRRIVKLWTNFVKTSIPSLDEDLNPTNIIWDTFSETSGHLDIGENLSITTDLSKYNIDWWTYFYTKFGTPPYNTY